MDNKTNKEFSSENLLKFYSNMNINNNVNQKKIHISKIKGIIFPLIIFNLLALVGLGNTEIISSISLKIHEKGYIQFIGYSKNDPRFPDEIKINNNLKTINENKYNFTSLENNIILTWYKTIENSSFLFSDCIKIYKIDLSNFNTLTINNITGMFYNCSSLISLNLSTFDTSKVKDMSKMFSYCSNLISLNLSKFNTNNVKYTDNMFNGCESLKILDFSNCEITSKITQYNDMFLNCNNLEYIDFRNFKSDFELSDTFLKGTQKNLVINTNESKLISILDNCTSLSYGDDWSKYKMKINTENEDCVYDCISTNYKYEYEYKCYPSCLNSTYNNSYKCEKCHSDCLECEGPYTENNSNCKICRSTDKFLYLGNCISECKRNYYIDNNTQQKICKCELTECDICSSESLKQNLCLSCDTINGYYPIYDYNYNNNYPYLNCTLSKEGYYLDNSEGKNIYKPCYSSCKTCNISGNEISHNCLECKNNYNFEINVNYYKNCYDNCSYYHYYDESEKILYCTNNFSCPKDYDKLIEDKRECVYNCSNDKYYKYEFRKKCYKDNCPSNSSIRNDSNELDRFSFDKNYFCKPICNEEYPFEIINTQECVEKCDFKNIYDNTCIINFKSEEKLIFNYDDILKNIELGFTSLDYNTSFLEQGNNKVFEFEQITITLTTSKNQKNDINNGNVTAIDLRECENKLREAYNISYNEEYIYENNRCKTTRNENTKNRI